MTNAQPAPASLNNVAGKSLITLETHMLNEERHHPDSQGALSWVVAAIGLAAKAISAKLRSAHIEDVLGAHGAENVQGEEQQKLDVIANDFMMASLRGHAGVAVLGSEEDEHLFYIGNPDAGVGRYAVLFDPLDGSSNLDTAGGVGTIFSIFRVEGEGEYGLRPGHEQVAAGYVLYGSSTVFVLSAGSGVHMFVLDAEVGAFIRVQEGLQIPSKGKTYSVNEANIASFPKGWQNYLYHCHNSGYSARYAGAMVADVHRLLLKGGVFFYPPTATWKASIPLGRRISFPPYT